VKILIVLAITLATFLLLARFNQYFTVRKIEVDGTISGQLIKGVGSYAGRSILLIAEDQLEKEVIRENSFIKEVKVKKVYPDTIKLVIISQKPLAVLKVNNGYFYLALDGRILAKEKKINEDLPLINYYQQFDYYSENSGNWMKYKEIETALQILRSCQDFGWEIDSIDINGLNMIAFKLNNKEILLTTEKDVKVQEYELMQIAHRFKIEGKDFEKIDLRFDKPVVLLKK
jgi:hypothetical protein